ncbi:MAG: DNRLRE domain-containing protein [Actinobacteria bacterium]|nr:DNRLRE domain-containing protein [Actinomycetota bacterium]
MSRRWNAWTTPLVAVAAIAMALTGVTSSDSASAVPATVAVADTYVNSTTPDTNYGTSGQLDVDNSPVRRTFIKFTVSGIPISEAVTAAKLRLHVDNISNGGSPNGGIVQTMSSSSWSETAVTWNNQPSIDGTPLGSLGSVLPNSWYEVDVTSRVTGNGTFSFGLTSSSSDGAYYDSRETGATAPQLVVTADPVILAAGDIASCSSSGDEATAATLAGQRGTVITTGDNAYESGTPQQFTDCYGPSWGKYKARTRPSPGNHEYLTSGASGYFNYFGVAAGDPTKGYYSYDLGNWHVVSLNSNCSIVSCSSSGPQVTWLRANLAANTKPCTLAYWHHARFSSGNHGSSSMVQPLYQALYDYNADLVLVGHDHDYEGFAPMKPTGSIDTARGIRQIVVGTGGRSHSAFGSPVVGSEARNSTAYGVLKVTLKANSYEWQFLPVSGQTFTDSNTQACH